MTKRLRLLDWNLNAFTTDRTAENLDRLEPVDFDVATLQELLPRSIHEVHERFPDCELFTRTPSDLWPRPASRRQCGVLVRRSLAPSGPVPIACDETPRPTRAKPDVPCEALVGVEITVGGVRLAVVSAHPPHAAGEGEEHVWRLRGKLLTYEALDRWLSTAETPVVVGMDSNWWMDASAFRPPPWIALTSRPPSPDSSSNRRHHMDYEMHSACGSPRTRRSWKRSGVAVLADPSHSRMFAVETGRSATAST
jgi:hypothetical protein